MTHFNSTLPAAQFSEIISSLNHKVTGSLARLEGLFHLCQQEGDLRDELWEQAFDEAKVQVGLALHQGFQLCSSYSTPVY